MYKMHKNTSANWLIDVIKLWDGDQYNGWTITSLFMVTCDAAGEKKGRQKKGWKMSLQAFLGRCDWSYEKTADTLLFFFFWSFFFSFFSNLHVYLKWLQPLSSVPRGVLFILVGFTADSLTPMTTLGLEERVPRVAHIHRKQTGCVKVRIVDVCAFHGMFPFHRRATKGV